MITNRCIHAARELGLCHKWAAAKFDMMRVEDLTNEQTKKFCAEPGKLQRIRLIWTMFGATFLGPSFLDHWHGCYAADFGEMVLLPTFWNVYAKITRMSGLRSRCKALQWRPHMMHLFASMFEHIYMDCIFAHSITAGICTVLIHSQLAQYRCLNHEQTLWNSLHNHSWQIQFEFSTQRISFCVNITFWSGDLKICNYRWKVTGVVAFLRMHLRVLCRTAECIEFRPNRSEHTIWSISSRLQLHDS